MSSGRRDMRRLGVPFWTLSRGRPETTSQLESAVAIEEFGHVNVVTMCRCTDYLVDGEIADGFQRCFQIVDATQSVRWRMFVIN